MPYISVKIKNGQEWGITCGEVVVPANGLKEMTSTEIGETVLALGRHIDDFWNYLQNGGAYTSFSSLEEFQAAAEVQRKEREEKERVEAEKMRQITEYQTKIGTVYVIRQGSHYKIGKTLNLSQRVKGLQTSSPERLEVVISAELSGFQVLETQLHQKYANKRRSGEWFSLTEDDLRDIAFILSATTEAAQ